MGAREAVVVAQSTHVLPLEFSRRYPVLVRGEGVWVEDASGNRYLDAMSGGSMAATLGHGRKDIIAAARAQAEKLAYVHNERLTNPPQEQLAKELVGVAPKGFTRARFVTGGAEANEMALQIARRYHVDRGERKRWQIISPAQAYHGPTMATLALTGRPGLKRPFEVYMSEHLHIPPSTWRFDPSGEQALLALDRALEAAGPDTVSAYFCEPISAAALPAYSPPKRFWEGLAERREKHGFLICFDEIVTGIGRTGRWFAAEGLPILPDIIATAKGLGAGYAAIGAVLTRDHVYDAIANGSRKFTLGHTWDGAPLSCAVGLAVIDVLKKEKLVERVRERGPRLRDQLAAALEGVSFVREVRGHGFLLGIEYVDPRDGKSFLPPELRTAGRVDDVAFEQGLITYSTMPTRDGFAGDQTLFAPPFTTTDAELDQMIQRLAQALRDVEKELETKLEARPVS
ncbi:MAG TPA: aminotransferase class III-fold pyridoxal phosphate-dependent enzyme [Candidatus Sulfotelmatobacter sp.]|nr:aminotransferase class III-fold pyridoxal phosphate-dependent enzyme [Candidatus Sulfotelmatobacter sp.]